MGKNIFFGFILITTGAFSSGSFAFPFGKIKGWEWESYWLIYNIGACIISPLTACLIFVPEIVNIYKAISSGMYLMLDEHLMISEVTLATLEKGL
jgi:L-rhamnose-H+ transport protein